MSLTLKPIRKFIMSMDDLPKVKILADIGKPLSKQKIDELIGKVASVDELHEIKVDNDNVNRPAHYTDGKIEVIDFIEDKKLGFCLGNAIKYISRAGKKDPTKEIEDLKKADWYIKRRIKELEEK